MSYISAAVSSSFAALDLSILSAVTSMASVIFIPRTCPGSSLSADSTRTTLSKMFSLYSTASSPSDIFTVLTGAAYADTLPPMMISARAAATIPVYRCIRLPSAGYKDLTSSLFSSVSVRLSTCPTVYPLFITAWTTPVSSSTAACSFLISKTTDLIFLYILLFGLRRPSRYIRVCLRLSVEAYGIYSAMLG